MRSIPSLQKRSASAVYFTLTALVIATAALAVFEQARGRRLVLEISKLGGDPHAPGADAIFGAVTIFAILIIFFTAAAIATVVAYLNWLLRAQRCADRRAVVAALASWFVPVVNLVAPVVLVDRLWRSSRPPADRRPRWRVLLAAWWLSWLVALTVVLVRLWPGVSQPSTGLTGFGPPELTAVTVAALLCAATVRQITGVQTAGARHRRRSPVNHPERAGRQGGAGSWSVAAAWESVPGPDQQPALARGVEPELVGAEQAIGGGFGPPEPALARITVGDLPPLTRDNPVVEDPVNRVELITPDELDGPSLSGPHLDRVAVESVQDASSPRGFG